MKKPPCIRGLREFRGGCPCITYSAEHQDGCPAWIEENVREVGDPLKIRIEKKCVDLWMFKIAWHSNSLLEGNQQATESFRNSMTELDPVTKKSVPKVDRGLLALLNYFEKIRISKQLTS